MRSLIGVVWELGARVLTTFMLFGVFESVSSLPSSFHINTWHDCTGESDSERCDAAVCVVIPVKLVAQGGDDSQVRGQYSPKLQKKSWGNKLGNLGSTRDLNWQFVQIFSFFFSELLYFFYQESFHNMDEYSPLLSGSSWALFTWSFYTHSSSPWVPWENNSWDNLYQANNLAMNFFQKWIRMLLETDD